MGEELLGGVEEEDEEEGVVWLGREGKEGDIWWYWRDISMDCRPRLVDVVVRETLNPDPLNGPVRPKDPKAPRNGP